MSRAYIVLARNDLDDSLLQVLDLHPNPTPSKGSRVYAPNPQGGYQTFGYRDGVNGDVATAAGVAGGASLDVDGDTYGLAAYLLDRVQDTTGNQSLTAAEANSIAGLILTDVAAGVDLSLTRVNTHINNPVGVAGSDLDGTLGDSTGSLGDILRILSGERYKLPDGSQVRAAGGTFDATIRGFFVSAPNVEPPSSRRTTYGGARALGGRAFNAPLSHVRPGEYRAGHAPIQAGTQDLRHNNVRATIDTGHLHLSAATGALSSLKSATFTFLNSAFTYGNGTALTIAGVAVPSSGQARAVVVYDADGTVI